MVILSESPSAKDPTIYFSTNNNMLDDATEGTKDSKMMDSPSRTSPKPSIDTTHHAVDNTVEFAGDVNTNNEIPTQEVLSKVESMLVLDKDGKTRPFKTLYSGPNVARRVLIIFIRHFFCGNCQEYIRTLTASITEDSLLTLHVPTFIAVVGCGSPSLIPMYQEATNCPFPIYADPTKKLYDELGMMRTLSMGPRPEYQRRGTMLGMAQSVMQSLKQIKGGKLLQGGDYQQVGGEFLFEPVQMATPISSPAVGLPEYERKMQASGGILGNGSELGEQQGYEEKKITWCHRMKNTRDHAEIPEIREVLGFDDIGEGGKDKKRWSKALSERKGTGINTGATSAATSLKLGGVSEDGGSIGSGRKSHENPTHMTSVVA
ncbi:fmHP protein [Rutstroemia sp. NJR-2017a WRK4]|nr:fmHP protein [Rutstroemia sp. NJR-2017a WRK4]